MAGGNQFTGLIGKGKRKANEREMGILHQDTGNLEKKHSRNKGSALQNSNEYENVRTTLDAIVFGMGSTWRFTNDVYQNEKNMTMAMRAYYKLLMACEEYIAKPGGKSLSGRRRKNKVKEIQSYAKRDIAGIEQAFYGIKGMTAEEQSRLNWDDIIHSARMYQIEVEDYDSATNLGGAAKTGDDVGKKLAEGAFAPNKVFNFAKKETGPKLSDQTNTMVDQDLNEKLIEDKVKTNMANRNVATSRVANLLGLGNLVAQSTLTTVKDKKTGEKRTGSLMTLARGVEAKSEIKNNVASKLTKQKDLQSREEMAKKRIAPSLQKELSSLQVLDYLCGQGDRHRGNYFLTKGKGEDSQYEHLQGIDNDLSFSSGVDNEKQLKDKKIGGGFLGGMNWRMVVDSENNITIPHMDKQLAQNILELKEEEIRFVLKDLLEDVFINQTIARLRKLKTGIKREMGNTNSDVFVEEGKWNEKTLNDFLEMSVRRHLDKDLQGQDLFQMRIAYYNNHQNAYEFSKHDSYISALVDEMIGYNMNQSKYDLSKE